MYWTPGPDNSILISTENAVPINPENNAKIRYKVPISFALLDKNQRSHHIVIPALVPASVPGTNSKPTEGSDEPKKPADLTYLIFWLRDNLLKERGELFVESVGLPTDGGPATQVGGTFYAVRKMIYGGLAVVAGG